MTTVRNIVDVRKDFPALSGTMRGKDLIYFDNGATSLKPQVVIESLQEYYTSYSANIHRGVYEMSERATAEYDRAREALYRFLSVDPAVGEVIFTHGTTESVNLIAHGWGLKELKPGDEIALTAMEHHANLVPWQVIAQRTGAVLRFFPLTAEATLSEEGIEATITPRTKLVAITGMSNVTGYMPPLDRIISLAHQQGARVLVDGAQLASHHPVNVQQLDCDFLVFSGHKMCGPTGIGVLYARRELLEEMDPFMMGGDMIREVHLEHSTWARVPEKFEAGTPHIAGAIGLGRAVTYLMDIGMERIAQHEAELTSYMMKTMKQLPYVERFGSDDEEHRGGIFSFAMKDVHPHDVGSLLDQQGIAVRTGFHCAQPLMRHFGITGTVRASFFLYNTTDEIDRFAQAVERLHGILG